ncbi:MAG: ABC transporter permease, partial [Thermodesulfobacteriota bacterium]
MDSIISGFQAAFYLIAGLNQELLGIILLSLEVSGLALVLSALLGLPLAALMGLKKFPARGILVTLLNTFMGLPPVVVGLFIYLLLSRSGPLGFMGLLYTPTAMIIAQTILAFPIVSSLGHSAIVNVNPNIRLAAVSLGATPLQTALTIIKEARYGIMSGVIAGFGR